MGKIVLPANVEYQYNHNDRVILKLNDEFDTDVTLATAVIDGVTWRMFENGKCTVDEAFSHLPHHAIISFILTNGLTEPITFAS